MWSALCVACVLAGLGVWIASLLIWLVVRWHDKDIQLLPDEQVFMDAMKVQGLSPGLYMWPQAGGDRQVHRMPDAQEKWNKGPWGVITMYPRRPAFVRQLIGSLWVHLAVAFGVGMSLGLVLSGVQLGSGVLISCRVCQILVPTFVLGVVVYGLGGLGTDLLLGKPRRFMGTSVLDGAVFAAVQSGVLYLLWPDMA